MGNGTPVFFFSYARENDPVLTHFFQKLQWHASHIGLGDLEWVGFRDVNNIKNGDDWNAKVTNALSESKVLICIFTPKFFFSEFCARELAAFLKRNKTLRYEAVTQPDGETKYQIRDAHNIIPILWTAEADLARHPDGLLPPYLLGGIQHAIETKGFPANYAEEYNNRGLRSTYNGASTRKRDDFALYFARAIRDAKPLPSVNLKFDDLWHSFRDVPPEYREGRPPPAATEASPALREPATGDLVAIELVDASTEQPWKPFRGDAAFGSVINNVAFELGLRILRITLNPEAGEFDVRARSIIAKAADKLAFPMLFVDPRSLRSERCRSALIRLRKHEWYGGIILPADESDEDAQRLIQTNLPTLRESHGSRARAIVRESLGIIGLRTAVDSVRIELDRRVAEIAEVQRKPAHNEGPEQRPRISNMVELSDNV